MKLAGFEGIVTLARRDCDLGEGPAGYHLFRTDALPIGHAIE
jgi:hypothetical protein